MAKKNALEIAIDIFYGLKDDFSVVVSTGKDKGIKFFQLPLAVGLAICVFSFMFIKRPALETIKRDSWKCDTIQTLIDNAKSYTPTKQRIMQYEERLPDIAEKGEWLGNQVLSVCRAQNHVYSSVTPQVEVVMDDFTVAELSFVVRMPSYEELGKLVAAIENNPKLLRITSINVTRDPLVVGGVTATVKVDTVFPNVRMSPPQQQQPQQALPTGVKL